MKPGPNSKRSRGRGNPRKQNSPRNTNLESNGPDIRVRGSLTQVLEKYLAMARDASSSGDPIAAENYFQHAEHYYRVLNANGGAHQGNQQRFRGPGQQHQGGNGGRDHQRADGAHHNPSGSNGSQQHGPNGGNSAPAQNKMAPETGGPDESGSPDAEGTPS